jgi:hypothetical protein
MVVFSFQPIFNLFIFGYILAMTSSCSKGKLFGNQNDGTKKINPYSGTDTETNPSDISGAWLVMCRSEPTSDGAFLLQCRANDRKSTKYDKNLDIKIKLPDGTFLDPSQITMKAMQDNFTFEATIRSPGPVRVDAKSSDGTVAISKSISLGTVQDLAGLLVGVCGFTNPLAPLPFPAEPPSSGCDKYRSKNIFSSENVCPTDYVWVPASSKFQGDQGTPGQQWGSGTCSLSIGAVDSQLRQEMLKSPADFAVMGAAYGHAFNWTSECFAQSAIPPMTQDCKCQPGFLLTEISSHLGGLASGRSYTCVALATGSRAAALQKDALMDLKTYSNVPAHQGNKTRCQNQNASWAPISANVGGSDQNWQSVCLSK